MLVRSWFDCKESATSPIVLYRYFLSVWCGIFLSSCASAPVVSESSEYEKGFIGKKYFNKYGVFELCQTPDFPINQQGRCEIVSEKEELTVSGVVDARNESFFKILLSDGRSGYIMDDEFKLIDQFSKPSPRIGMTADQAEDTSWGLPETKNVTKNARHRFEQWVFPKRGYLYIEDGLLATIQRTEE